jgi:hypothetical protein
VGSADEFVLHDGQGVHDFVEGLAKVLPFLVDVFRFLFQKMLVELAMEPVKRRVGLVDGVELRDVAEHVLALAVEPLPQYALVGLQGNGPRADGVPGGQSLDVMAPTNQGGTSLAQFEQSSVFVHLSTLGSGCDGRMLPIF